MKNNLLLVSATALALSTGTGSAFPWHDGCTYYSVTASPQANVRPVPTLRSKPLWTIHSIDRGSPLGSILYCGQYFMNDEEPIIWMWVSFYFPYGYDGGADHEGWMSENTLTPYYPPSDQKAVPPEALRNPPTEFFDPNWVQPHEEEEDQ